MLTIELQEKIDETFLSPRHESLDLIMAADKKKDNLICELK